MTINKSNYEAFFLDYHEGNLTPLQVADLLLFVAQHPEIEEEFKSIECFTLDESDSVIFENKEELKKHASPTPSNNSPGNQRVNGVIRPEILIASMEGLLMEEEAKLLHQQLLTDASLKKEYERYQQTKLIADSSIVFKNKETLKHKNNFRKVIPLYYYVAAAASILLLFGFSFLSYKNDEKIFSNNFKTKGSNKQGPISKIKDVKIEELKTIASVYTEHKNKTYAKTINKSSRINISKQPKQKTIVPENEISINTEKELVQNKLDTTKQFEISKQQISINKPVTEMTETIKSIRAKEHYLPMRELAAIKIKEKTLDKTSFAAEKKNDRLKKFSAWDFAQIITKGISKISGHNIEVKPTYNDEGDVTAYALGIGGVEISRAR